MADPVAWKQGVMWGGTYFSRDEIVDMFTDKHGTGEIYRISHPTEPHLVAEVEKFLPILKSSIEYDICTIWIEEGNPTILDILQHLEKAHSINFVHKKSMETAAEKAQKDEATYLRVRARAVTAQSRALHEVQQQRHALIREIVKRNKINNIPWNYDYLKQILYKFDQNTSRSIGEALIMFNKNRSDIYKNLNHLLIRTHDESSKKQLQDIERAIEKAFAAELKQVQELKQIEGYRQVIIKEAQLKAEEKPLALHDRHINFFKNLNKAGGDLQQLQTIQSMISGFKKLNNLMTKEQMHKIINEYPNEYYGKRSNVGGDSIDYKEYFHIIVWFCYLTFPGSAAERWRQTVDKVSKMVKQFSPCEHEHWRSAACEHGTFYGLTQIRRRDYFSSLADKWGKRILPPACGMTLASARVGGWRGWSAQKLYAIVLYLGYSSENAPFLKDKEYTDMDYNVLFNWCLTELVHKYWQVSNEVVEDEDEAGLEFGIDAVFHR
jgi:hypothetical protein